MKFNQYDRSSYDDAVACYHCGGQCTHQGAVTVYERDQDAETTAVTRVDHSGVTTMHAAERCGNPSRRRHGLRIAMECEGCGDLGHLVVYQHKGATFIEWDDTEAKLRDEK